MSATDATDAVGRPDPSASYLLETALFVFVFGLGSYFYNGYGWNQTARYDAIWAFVEPGPHQHTFAIDAFVTDAEAGLNTGDYARNPDHSPHFYSNKAPGTSLLGIPAYFVLFHVERALGIDPVSIRAVLTNAYLINLWVTVLPVAARAASSSWSVTDAEATLYATGS